MIFTIDLLNLSLKTNATHTHCPRQPQHLQRSKRLLGRLYWQLKNAESVSHMPNILEPDQIHSRSSWKNSVPIYTCQLPAS